MPARRTAGLSQALTWLLVASMAFGVVNLAILLVAGFRFGLVMTLAAVAFLVSVPTIIVFCIWLHRTLSNARDRAPAAGIHPGWAVGSFFVPFVQLVAPLIEVRRAWIADTGRPGTLVAIWLVAWSLITLVGFVSGFMGAAASFRQALDDADDGRTGTSLQDQQEASWRAQRPFSFASLVLNLVAGTALIFVSRQWTALQDGRPAS